MEPVASATVKEQPLRPQAEARQEPTPGSDRWWPFVLVSIAAFFPIAVITVMFALHFGGSVMTDHIKDGGVALAAFAAAGSLAGAAWRAPARTRQAWILLAVAGASAFVGQMIELFGDREVFPSTTEIGILIAIPFACAGLLLFPTAQNLYASRLHALLDLLMVAFSLAFIAIAFGLLHDYANAGLFGPLFPAADVLLLTVLLVVLRRNRPTRRGRLNLMLLGFAVIALADSTNTILSAEGLLPAGRIFFAAGPMYGFTLVALAPLWPRGVERHADGDSGLWRALLPYAGVIALMATAIGAALNHKPINQLVDLPAAGLVLVLIASQILSFVEGRALLRQSRESEAKVRERETMLNSVIDHAPQGVARITLDRKLANSNPRLASILYAPRRIVEGYSLEKFLPGEDVQRAFGSFAVVKDDSQETVELDSRARRADGSEFWMHWNLTPIRKPDASIDYYIAMFEDITAKRDADETAAANLQQMEKLNKLKSEFVSMVSHEFRSALVGIQGFSELIRDDDLEVADMKNLAGDINKDALRLNRMITEMLEFDRMEAGKIHLELKPLDINALVLDCVDHARVMTAKHVVTENLQPDLPMVSGDADRLTQVLINLLSNAIKYSPDGGEISVRSRLEGSYVEVAVKDQGLGIPPEFIGRLFGRYERYEDKHAGKIIGTGLGLAITRQIVEMHGGKITVESTVGSGSEFKFTVPVSLADGARRLK
jgi:PAS domain S-box-containing protein